MFVSRDNVMTFGKSFFFLQQFIAQTFCPLDTNKTAEPLTINNKPGPGTTSNDNIAGNGRHEFSIVDVDEEEIAEV